MVRTLLSVMLAGSSAMLFSGDTFLPSAHTPSAMLVFSADVPADMAAVANEPAGASSPVTVERERDGLFYVNGRVNGVPVRFLFDTGASQTVLTARDARRIGLDSKGARAGMLITASGRVATRNAPVARIDVAGQTIEDTEAMVVGKGLPVSLLGQNVLSRMNGVTVDRDTLRFH